MPHFNLNSLGCNSTFKSRYDTGMYNTIFLKMRPVVLTSYNLLVFVWMKPKVAKDGPFLDPKRITLKIRFF